MTNPLAMFEKNTWQTQVYAVCDHFGVQYPDYDEWQILMAKWEPGTKARDTVQKLVDMRKPKDQDEQTA